MNNFSFAVLIQIFPHFIHHYIKIKKILLVSIGVLFINVVQLFLFCFITYFSRKTFASVIVFALMNAKEKKMGKELVCFHFGKKKKQSSQLLFCPFNGIISFGWADPTLGLECFCLNRICYERFKALWHIVRIWFIMPRPTIIHWGPTWFIFCKWRSFFKMAGGMAIEFWRTTWTL